MNRLFALIALRGRLMIAGLSLLALYGLAGSLLLPRVLETRLLTAFAMNPDLHIAVADIGFRPFGPELTITGLTLTDALGQPVLNCDRLDIDLELLQSLRHRKPVLVLELESPELHLTRDAAGHWNLAALIPQTDPNDVKPLPISLGAIRLSKGHIIITDGLHSATQPRHLGPLQFELGSIGDAATLPVPFELALQGRDVGGLTVGGTLNLNPLSVSGRLEAEALNLSFWLDTLAPQLPWRVSSGTLSTRASFDLGATHDPVGDMAVAAEGFSIDALELTPVAAPGPDLRLSRLALEALNKPAGEQNLSIGTLSLSNATRGQGTLSSLEAQDLSVDLKHADAQLAALRLRQLVLPSGKLERLDFGAVRFESAAPHLWLASLALSRCQGAWGNLTGLLAQNINYAVADQRIVAESMTLRQLATPELTVTGLPLQGMASAPTLRDLRLDLPGHTVSASAINSPLVSSSWGKASQVVLTAATYHWDSSQLDLSALTADAFSATWGEVAHTILAGLRYQPGQQQLTLASASLTGARLHDVRVGSAHITALSAGLTDQRFSLQSATVSDLIGQSPLAADPAAAITAPGAGLAGGAPTADGEAPRPFQLGRLALEDARGDIRQRRLTARALQSDDLQLDLIRRDDHQLAFRGVATITLTASRVGPDRLPWQLDIGDLDLDRFSLHYLDETTQPPARLRFNHARLHVDDLSTRNEMDFKLYSKIGENGKVEADGRASLNPFSASFRFGIDKLRLKSVEPYWRPLTGIDLVRGRLNIWGDMVIHSEPTLQVDYEGAADIVELDSVDRAYGKPFAKWNSLKFDGLAISTHPHRLMTRILTAEQPYLRFAFDQDQNLNLLQALAPPSQEAVPPELATLHVHETPRGQPPTGSIGLLRIKDGLVDFTDLAMEPGFSTELPKLNGTITGLSTRANTLATLVMDGRISRNSPVQVFGALQPMDFRDNTDVTLVFKALNLTSLSSYSGKFAGYRIERGKLDMDLRYRLMQGRLAVENRAVLDRLTLGERVDHPNASSWLADLAVALLKDSGGRIDLDLPISGNLDNPQFSLLTLYRDVFIGLFSKLFQSPFNLMNDAIRAGDEPLDSVGFAAGEDQLSPDSQEQLTRIASTLADRYEFSLDIQASADPERDRLALAKKALDEQLKNDRRAELRRQGVRLHGAPVPDLGAEDYRRLFTGFYRQQHPHAPELIALAPGASLNDAAFSTAKVKTLAAWRVDDLTLRQLAQRRAENIRGFLIEQANLPDSRIYLKDVRLLPAGAASIMTRLTLSSS